MQTEPLRGSLSRGNSNHLSFASLNSKIALSKSNLLLSWVTILGNQIASVSCEHIVLNFTFRTTSEFDHFRNLTKMVIYIDSQ